MPLDPLTYRLSEADNERIFETTIKPSLFFEASSVSTPVAVLFGGQPGSGKSPAIVAARQEFNDAGGAVEIIGDDLRPYHPAYAKLLRQDDQTAATYTAVDAGLWVEKAIAYAKAERFNVIIEGTMRDPNVVAGTAKSLRDAGYKIDARALAVPYHLSELGIMQRYEAQKADRGAGRMTAPEAHQAAYAGMLTSLNRIERERLVDRLTIYRRGNEVLYFNELRGGDWATDPQAAEVVRRERDRPMTLKEAVAYADRLRELEDLVRRPGRNASRADIENVSQMSERAEVALAARDPALAYRRRLARPGPPDPKNEVLELKSSPQLQPKGRRI